MKKLAILAIMLFCSSVYSNSAWRSLPVQEKIDILIDLDITDFPLSGTKSLLLDIEGQEVDEPYNGKYHQYVNRMLNEYDEKVHSGSIEHSPFSTAGRPKITTLALLIDLSTQKVLGGHMYVRQYGLNESRRSQEVEWSVSIQTDEYGIAFEELYRFEWSAD